jgi:hypothetical protein
MPGLTHALVTSSVGCLPSFVQVPIKLPDIDLSHLPNKPDVVVDIKPMIKLQAALDKMPKVPKSTTKVGYLGYPPDCLPSFLPACLPVRQLAQMTLQCSKKSCVVTSFAACCVSCDMW